MSECFQSIKIFCNNYVNPSYSTTRSSLRTNNKVCFFEVFAVFVSVLGFVGIVGVSTIAFSYRSIEIKILKKKLQKCHLIKFNKKKRQVLKLQEIAFLHKELTTKELQLDLYNLNVILNRWHSSLEINTEKKALNSFLQESIDCFEKRIDFGLRESSRQLKSAIEKIIVTSLREDVRKRNSLAVIEIIEKEMRTIQLVSSISMTKKKANA